MRITNGIIHRRSLDALQENLRALEEAHTRAASGLRIQKPSDDPAATVGVMNTDRRLRALDQYSRNIDSARSRYSAEEGVLDQMGDVLSRARELAVAQGGSPANGETRAVTKVEVDQLLEQMIALGNTRFGGGYLFGGQFAEDAPLAADGTVSTERPPTGTRTVEIGAGQTTSAGHDAVQVFMDSGVITSLKELSAALAADSSEAIGAASRSIESAFGQVQDLLGETGARVNRLEVAQANVEALGTSLRSFRSDLAEVDFEEAVAQLVSRQTTFQAALTSTSRMISLTLADYLG